MNLIIPSQIPIQIQQDQLITKPNIHTGILIGEIIQKTCSVKYSFQIITKLEGIDSEFYTKKIELLLTPNKNNHLRNYKVIGWYSFGELHPSKRAMIEKQYEKLAGNGLFYMCYNHNSITTFFGGQQCQNRVVINSELEMVQSRAQIKDEEMSMKEFKKSQEQFLVSFESSVSKLLVIVGSKKFEEDYELQNSVMEVISLMKTEETNCGQLDMLMSALEKAMCK